MKWLAIALTATFGIVWLFLGYMGAEVRSASTILRSENVSQLLTNRVVTQIFVTRDFSDPLFGSDKVMAVGPSQCWPELTFKN